MEAQQKPPSAPPAVRPPDPGGSAEGFVENLLAATRATEDRLLRLLLFVAILAAFLARWALAFLVPLVVWAFATFYEMAVLEYLGLSQTVAFMVSFATSWVALIPVAWVWGKVIRSPFIPE